MNTLIRWWHLIIHPSRCIELIFEEGWYKPKPGNIVYTNGPKRLKYLGKNWYLILKDKMKLKEKLKFIGIALIPCILLTFAFMRAENRLLVGVPLLGWFIASIIILFSKL